MILTPERKTTYIPVARYASVASCFYNMGIKEDTRREVSKRFQIGFNGPPVNFPNSQLGRKCSMLFWFPMPTFILKGGELLEAWDLKR